MGQGEFRSSMAVQKGGRKGDGAAQDKETRANSQRSLFACAFVCAQPVMGDGRGGDFG